MFSLDPTHGSYFNRKILLFYCHTGHEIILSKDRRRKRRNAWKLMPVEAGLGEKRCSSFWLFFDYYRFGFKTQKFHWIFPVISLTVERKQEQERAPVQKPILLWRAIKSTGSWRAIFTFKLGKPLLPWLALRFAEPRKSRQTSALCWYHCRKPREACCPGKI